MDFLKIQCFICSTFGVSSPSPERLNIHDQYSNFYIKKIEGEYKIKYISMSSIGNEFDKMISKCVMEMFNDEHVLVNARRPTKAWIQKQLETKTIEKLSLETNISLYRLNKIIEY